jgi:glycosyltransferase involved in cell wall biosynthesis
MKELPKRSRSALPDIKHRDLLCTIIWENFGKKRVKCQSTIQDKVFVKILFLSSEYPPCLIGGAGVYAVHITRELAKLGHEVHVISTASNKKDDNCSIEHSVFVHRIPIVDKPFLHAPSFWFNLWRKYDAICEDAGGFDVIHSNVVSDFSLSEQKIKTPRVVTIHHLARSVVRYSSFKERLLELSGETGLTPIIEKRVIRRADKIIAVSKFTRSDLISTYNVLPSRIEVVYNGVYPSDFVLPPEEILKTKKSFAIENNTVFLFVGRVDDKRKGLPLLLKAFRILSKKERSVRLVIVGSGNQAYARLLSKSLGLEKSVVFTGYVDNVLLRKIYRACDVFVLPSLLEGFGLVILEAMSSEKPIVGMNKGAIPELVRDRVNGLLVNKQDPQELANAMAFFADHPSFIRDIGKRNRELALNFSWAKSAKLTEQVYKSVLKVTC